MVIGAPTYDYDPVYPRGRAYYYRGSSSGLESSASWVITGDRWINEVGKSVSTAGDVNGDGYADLIIGMPAVGSSGSRVEIYHGGSSGPSP